MINYSKIPIHLNWDLSNQLTHWIIWNRKWIAFNAHYVNFRKIL